MFDPLNSTAAVFGGDDPADDVPAWPTTPHIPNSPIPNLRRADSSIPPTPDKGPADGLYGKEPKIYGQPEAGLISPRETLSSDGKAFEKPDPYLRVRITGLDRNRRDILIKLDAQTNLSNFTGTTYRNVSRSYSEFQQFYESIVHSNPQTIIPALPLAQTSAATDEEDDRLVKIMLQRWITRVCEDPILLYDEDLRSFVESDFGYQPTPRPRRKTSSGFGLMKRGVPDEDEELQRARFELTKLEGQFFETAKAVDKLALARKSLSIVHAEMGNKLISVATTEAHPPLGNALRKLGRTWHSLADLDQAQAISECVILGDSLGYQGLNARSAKETLQQRTGVLEEYQSAVKTTISKRRHIERLKASSNIRPERVDEALEEMEEANKYEQILARRAEGISQNLHKALQTYNRHANDDITSALIEHARSSIMYERQLLRELEALRVDVSTAADKAMPPVAVPKPTIVPPLEDYSRPSMPSAPVADSIRNTLPPPPNTTQTFNNRGPPFSSPAQSASQPTSPLPDSMVTSSSGRPSPSASHQGFASPSSSQFASPSRQQFLSSPSFQSGLPRHSLPQPSSPLAPQSPGAGPSSPAPQYATYASSSSNIPPLGGRFVDGTQSMFTKPQSTAPARQTPAGPLANGEPCDPLIRPTTASPTIHSSHGFNGVNGYPASQGGPLDPLGQAMPKYMSQSMRIQPARPRLDAREAASKLANMF
ncbi:hypothetical protein BDN71DRAFT_342241 [Pleurotus eryngii]|uniref:PX domain-containing protein n=1 Tax=Pleurotus eryngii TaxID=5323 RepID=A0A9P6A2U2_PLEER|nr:hypothetical protein BDN71DRAFT_342241 [Pleurotus eryngii]